MNIFTTSMVMLLLQTQNDPNFCPPGRIEIFPSDTTHVLEEVSVLSGRKKTIETEMKLAATVDEFLASSEKISFIKRGGYAWEPLLNNMSTERSIMTIDGMHVFGACTDKMDPVTSYVESNNLSSIQISSGQEGNMHGATVAGSIDLQRRSTTFSEVVHWNGRYQMGFESNNKQHFQLGNLSYSSKQFVADGSIAWRKAGNYRAGRGIGVQHSQFQKLNSSLGLAYKTGPLSSLRLDALYDQANDVGYPALPMDLWLSRALITSAAYKQLFDQGLVQAWDTKVYYNAVEHYMDDTTRPDNLVHMDMPGWSTTYGLISRTDIGRGDYRAELQLNAYTNTSIAEMTMYPQDRSHQTMFAYTWPWVSSYFTGLAMNNSWAPNDDSRLNFGASLGWNRYHAKYVEFNRIFHPGAPQGTDRILPGVHARYQYYIEHLSLSAGLGYGHRAPSVSEAYGYYIYNSFDRYDYVGNPDLPNEISYEMNASVSYQTQGLTVEITANYFHIQNYIVGHILGLGSPMNEQSVGVKAYTALPDARLFNLAIQAQYDILPHLHWSGTWTYARSQDDQAQNLPFIRPFSYQTIWHYMQGDFGVRTSLHGDLAQIHYSPAYGEDLTPAYLIWNLSGDYTFHIGETRTVLQLGAENITDTFYSTYADWGNIPRMGRNIYTSLTFNF